MIGLRMKLEGLEEFDDRVHRRSLKFRDEIRGALKRLAASAVYRKAIVITQIWICPSRANLCRRRIHEVANHQACR
jgi:hypothetical protein